MSTPAICLWFDRDAEDAARLYTSALRDGKIGRTTHYLDPDPSPAGRDGEVLTVEFEAEGLRFVGLNGGPNFTFSPACSIQVYRETQQELDETWDALLAGGGEPGPCGWLTDRFGFSWQVIPSILDAYTASEDPGVARRATEAMLKMHKIDIAAIEAAAAGR